jgi:hypothetical protein
MITFRILALAATAFFLATMPVVLFALIVDDHVNPREFGEVHR